MIDDVFSPQITQIYTELTQKNTRIQNLKLKI